MKLCKNCKHHYKIPGTTDRCYHPRFGVEEIYGTPEWLPCTRERRHSWLMTRQEHTCGKEGRYFEAKQ